MRRVSLPTVLALLLAAGAALADIDHSPIRARLTPPASLPAPGREVVTSITIEAAGAATLRDLQIAGEGWTVTRWDASRDLALAPRGTVSIAFAATPRPGFGPLVLSAEVDGRPWQQTFQLSAEAYGGILPTDSDLLPPRRVLPASGEKFPEAPRFTLAELSSIAAAEDAAPALDKGRTTCLVTGKVQYWHTSANGWVPAFGAMVRISVFPPDGLPYQIGFEDTDEQGQFAIEAPTDVNIAIAFYATNRAVRVQEDGIWEDDYSWMTAMFSIPENTTQYDAGSVHPNSHNGALHICTDVTYAHDHFRDLGWDVDQVDVQWPDDDGSLYLHYWEEIHIAGDDGFNDGTICHEWAHYWHHQHAHAVEMDYCNGICDDGDDCGHCGWCPEEDEVAWMEGSAQFLSRMNTDYIEAAQYHFAPVHKRIDSHHDDPGCDWEPWNIEFVFGGAVYDMFDDDQGTETDVWRTDVLGNMVYDQLDLQPADILQIMTEPCDCEGHEPYRAPGFFRCAAEYLAAQGSPQATPAMLWETAWNWDLQLDTQAPATVPALTSTFPLHTPTQTAVGGFYWDQPADDLSGACAYSLRLSLNSAVAPDHEIDTTDLQWWPDDQLAPGTYYFTVIAVDRAGNWCATHRTYGPIIITAPGPADLESETPTGWTAPLVLRSTLAPAAPSPVVQANYVQGHTVYFNWAERNNGTGPTGNFQDRMFLDGAPVYTSNTHYLAIGAGIASRNQGPVDLGVTGRHTVWVRLDGLDNVPESDENDNIYAKQFVFSSEELSLGETVVRAEGLPDALAGQDLVPGGTTFYPNGDGFDIEVCVFPELVWAVPDDPADRLVMRLHGDDVGQTGFATPLATSTSLANRPAAIVQNPSETLLTSYCVGVSDEQGSGNTYRIHRETGQAFAMPDTIPGVLDAANGLDMYLAYNELDEAAWFTIKLANPSASMLWLRYFEPGFTMGSLAAADTTIVATAGDTIHHSVMLPPGEMAIAVVARDPRRVDSANYAILAYVAKPDLEAATLSGWFANVVPHVGTPYSPSQDDVPAPTRLVGDADSTGIYWSLRNASQSAGVPTGLRRRVDLDGASLIISTFFESLPPGHEIRAVHSSLQTMRGGRHTLSHRLNDTHAIDEDDYANNNHGRQWVWAPRLLAASQNHALPMPVSSYGGLTYVDEGLVAPNCDGYRFTTTIPVPVTSVLALYAVDETTDIDVGLYSSANVQSGYTTALAQSTWSGPGGDFVLRCTTGAGTFTHYAGVVRASGSAAGTFTLRAQASTAFWANPVGGTRTGTIEADTFLDTVILTLPTGAYRVTLQSDDESLGFSLHDLSAAYSAKTTPWQDGIAWQEAGQAGQDVSFVVAVPDPAPTRFCLVVWRPDGSSLAQDAAWTVTISTDVTDVDDGSPLPASVTVSRLVSAAPNPFNPLTEIAFEAASSGRCELTVHDVRGRLVRTLVAGDRPAGRHEARWDGLDDAGERVPSGIYMARLRTARGEVDLLKLTLVK